jgi:type I restriction enzyme S subunit
MNNWPKVRLGEILTERRETPDSNDLDSGRVKIVEKISFSTGEIQLRSNGSTKTGMILVRPGDLFISGINAAKGAIAIYDDSASEPAAATIHYGAYIPNREMVDVHFLWWMLRSRFFKELLSEYVPGGIKTELKAKRLLPIPVPLPPIAEQKRIVMRIEELAAQIQEAQTLRQQSVLEADVLLVTAISNVFQIWSTTELTIYDLVGGSGLRNGKSVKSCGDNSDVHCLTLSAMRNGRINVQDSKPVPLSLREAEPFFIHQGDVFIIRGNGSKDLCGRAGLVVGTQNSIIFPDLFIKVPLQRDRILPEFFVAVWNSAKSRAVIEDKAKTTSGIWKINQGHILSITIPCPSLIDQRRIIAELDVLQAEVDRLKRLQAETATEIDALLPAILDKYLTLRG